MKKTLHTLIFIFFVQVSFAQFITTWETVFTGQEITIPINKSDASFNYNYSVDWGDGEITTNHTTDATHKYGDADTYTVKITGSFPAIKFTSSQKGTFQTIEQWGTNSWITMKSAFANCTNIIVNATDSPNLSNATDLSAMFANATVSFTNSINNWDVSTITDMSNLFKNLDNFNKNISNWNTANVTDMGYMFQGASAFNQDISNWNTANVTSMGYLFDGATSFNQNISNWDVSNVKKMNHMFNEASSFNQNIGNWNVSNVTNMYSMFYNASSFNKDISNWNVSNVLFMDYMFNKAYAFNQNLENWDVANVISMSYMFKDATSFNQDIGGWNTSKVTDLRYIFWGASSFNQDISNWDTSNVTNLNYVFNNAVSFNQDIGSWDVSNVTDMSHMLTNSGLSTTNYDALLTGWASQSVQPSVILSANSLNFCNAETARTTLTSEPNNWRILGDTKNCLVLTSITDTNFEQFLIDENIDSDATINGQVLTTDIENITQLLMSDKNISNLTGIQDFTNLVELEVANNQISNIDLSKNLLLEKIFIANNQLSTIDVSNNTKLKNLDVGENNLSDLEVHFLSDLETLSCYKNQITTINLLSNKKILTFIANENQLKIVDIRENKDLFWIDVEDNLLESLTIKNDNNTKITTFSATGNSNLTCIEVDDANYSTTNWTNKDATANYSTDCAPANDDCANAIPLIFEQQTPGDVNSGTSNNNPSCAVGNVIADVWFSVIVPQTGEFSIEGSGFGGQLKFAIYQNCASLAPIACGTSISLKNLNVGTKFYLKVWLEAASSKSTNNQTETGTFNLKVRESSVLSVANTALIDNEISIYPNPAKDLVTISLKNKASISAVKIYTILGKLVYLTKVKNSINKIDTSSLSSGIYILKIEVEGKSVTKKLVIK